MNNENIDSNNKKEEVISINVLMKYIIEVKDFNCQDNIDKWSGLYKNYIKKYYDKSAHKKELDQYRASDRPPYHKSLEYFYSNDILNHQYALCLYYAIQNGEVEQSIIDEIREFAIAGL